MEERANIIAALQQDILLRTGFRPATAGSNQVLSLIADAFPNKTFPTSAVHEFVCEQQVDVAATSAFITGIVAGINISNGAIAWIGERPVIFPPALIQFGIDPSAVLFIRARQPKDNFYVTEEALRCEGITAVVSEINEINLTESRRLQLAVEHLQTTAFLIRRRPRQLSSVCVARWRVSPISSADTEMPGVHFPRWNVALQKIRHGKPGQWQMEWSGNAFQLIKDETALPFKTLRKAV